MAVPTRRIVAVSTKPTAHQNMLDSPKRVATQPPSAGPIMSTTLNGPFTSPKSLVRSDPEERLQL